MTGYTIPWHLGALTAFDLESTGISTRTARIVTGYVATVGPAGRRRERTVGARVLIDPGVPIPAGASAVHGITDAKAQADGLDPADGVNGIAEALARSLLARIPVAGFNLAYDCTLLHYECIRHDVPTVSERLGLPPGRPYGPIIDASVLDKHFDQYRKGSRKLDDSKGPGVATHYGVPLGANAHEAEADAIAALRVTVVIAERFAGPDMPTDPVALHQMQKLWRADQMDGLERHFRKTRPKAFVDRCWPICLDDTHIEHEE